MRIMMRKSSEMKQVLTSEQKPTFNADDNGIQASLGKSYIL
ncbi:hypothetical protein LEP1GSC103_3389 [Leptospira borgpetersenii serovar Javanica str. UI 09931]|uniref:Uncharacterized protein n=2 Tax=Leptospira borgpetersenii TaxID=174 RepID=A0AAV3JFT0_LEPBO|nr:hypothetical protein LEP1GSC101_3528 [Leptospira borgpetersenii str. UI 09149]EKQ98670.1 hypothetical protein LEP1GSC121_3013 [Leptospira borgpetersenii serovar Castellonis str. 200801910]EMN15764.1 hypothetical protein LEP1GSC056_4071 [Leptospira borgpetersenii str. Brem 328]EMN60113.1 hypothetical protein LEP1GSC090_3485 [Leptospira borgpetersenii serovar Javanica str. MK146]EMO11321.1 hypothetical protein LEP1GSC137_1377 [Leptospira borgpetersenii str. Noumea 25]EPG59633.1 hypothetical p